MDQTRESSALSLAQHAVRLQTLLDRQIAPVLTAHGLSRSELEVLGALANFGDAGARPRELSSRLLLTTGGLSNILRRLHDDGLINREPDASDARSHTIRLTAKGRTTARATGLAASDAIGHLLGPIDTSVLQTTAKLLHQLLTDLDDDSPVHRDLRRTR